MTMALQIAPSAARVEEGGRLCAPPEALAADAAVERFRYGVNARLGLDLADYDALWHWSIDDSEAFWAAIWAYFDIQSDTPYQRVRSRREMPGVLWFEGSRVNYAEHLLRHESRTPDAPALLHASDLRPLDRKSVVLGKRVSVRVALGGRRIIKKK